MALIALVVVGAPAFIIGGRYWVGRVERAEAVERYRQRVAAEPSRGVAVAGLPAPGVYRYRTTGGEKTSFLEYKRNYPAETMRIITRHGCGVREEQWFLVQHLEYYDRCGDRLVAYGTDIAYWWTHGTQDFKCGDGTFDGSRLRVGESSRWECRDEDTRAAQTTEYVGDETVEIGGRSHPVRHTRWTTQFTGATKGTAVVDDWFDPATGLVLKESRRIGLRVGSPFVGEIGYVDNSDFTLVSLVPDR